MIRKKTTTNFREALAKGGGTTCLSLALTHIYGPERGVQIRNKSYDFIVQVGIRCSDIRIRF